MKKVILWLLIVFFSVLIISSMVGGSYEGFEEEHDEKEHFEGEDEEKEHFEGEEDEYKEHFQEGVAGGGAGAKSNKGPPKQIK